MSSRARLKEMRHHQENNQDNRRPKSPLWQQVQRAQAREVFLEIRDCSSFIY
jgi:hypothetical protein